MHDKQDNSPPWAIKTEACAFDFGPGDDTGPMLSVLPEIPAQKALAFVGEICEHVGDVVFDIERGKFSMQDMQWALNLNLSIATALLRGVQSGLLQASRLD